jgi:thiamine pyrophosphate-dependent acetolactate synthase large subunit-like protein
MDQAKDLKVGRRGFLRGAAIGGAAIMAEAPGNALAQTPPASAKVPPVPKVGPPSRAAEGVDRSDRGTQTSSGGDYMVDVMRSLKIDYVAATPGNTFMGIHEAIINYGMLTEPKMTHLTTLHEEASVAMAHGYSKVALKPMACMMHTAVGLQHGSMAIYNAYTDRAAIFMIVGAHYDGAKRRGSVDWEHAVNDGPGLVRDFTKWDDSPTSLLAFGESAVEAYKFATTPPYGPVLLAVDQDLQDSPIPGDKPPGIPKLPRVSVPVAEPGAIKEMAQRLVAAQTPVLIADRVSRTPAGMTHMIELAETLNAPVCDVGGRMNFPWRHPLNQSSRQALLVSQADLVLGMEVQDFASIISQRDRDGKLQSRLAPGGTRISMTSQDLFMKSNYQVQQRLPDVELAVAADSEATLPLLIEEVKRLIGKGNSAMQDRGDKYAKAHLAELQRSRNFAAVGWDDKPISVPRLCQELYEQIRREDWALVSDTNFQSAWPQQLWDAHDYHRYIGGPGAWGIGYMAPAVVGAALAHKEHGGRVCVSIQGDGDLMFGPGILWTAAHEQIPILYLMHNNRCYQAEIMQLQAFANRRQRGADRVHIGTAISEPNIDYAMMAKSMGVYSEGPITDPKDLGAAIKRAVAVVKKGEPALVDVVCQGR